MEPELLTLFPKDKYAPTWLSVALEVVHSTCCWPSILQFKPMEARHVLSECCFHPSASLVWLAVRRWHQHLP